MLNIIYIVLSWMVVGFGMSVWSPLLAIAAASVGYALFWRVLLEVKTQRKRFWLAAYWFTAVQLVQLSWFVSHPFAYIYSVYLFFSGAKGIQFGLIFMFLTKERMEKFSTLLALAGSWTFMEWVRLFFMAGYTFNPTGLALGANVYSLQIASLFGVYGMTFFVMLTNLFFLRLLLYRDVQSISSWAVLSIFPYFFGFVHLSPSTKQFDQDEVIHTLLVQPDFPAEEVLNFQSPNGMIQYVLGEWQDILKILSKHKDKDVDLIVLPEFVVPYEAYLPLFNYETVRASFAMFFGKKAEQQLPEPTKHTMMSIETPNGSVQVVNHVYICQAIADLFNACLVAGLEDGEIVDSQTKQYHSSAYVFYPKHATVDRYDKRVLVPLGEYIPFSFLRDLAKRYGVTGSFTAGKEAKVFDTPKASLGLSICYEETFGNLMCENRIRGAELLVNLTNDAWYPHSMLPWQHMEHARLRTVEMGIPLVRACNTGVTCAIDSHGRDIAILSDENGNVEDIAEALYVSVPKDTYQTLYSKTGDFPIVALSSFCFFIALLKRKRIDLKNLLFIKKISANDSFS